MKMEKTQEEEYKKLAEKIAKIADTYSSSVAFSGYEVPKTEKIFEALKERDVKTHYPYGYINAPHSKPILSKDASDYLGQHYNQFVSPTWPRQFDLTVGDLLSIPGFNSSRHDTYPAPEYYDQLMSNLHRTGPQEAWAIHRKMVAKKESMNARNDLVWMDEVSNLELDTSYWDARIALLDSETECPFDTADELEEFGLYAASHEIRQANFSFTAKNTIFEYRGKRIPFIGLEQYRLVWVSWDKVVGGDGEVVDRPGVFHFEAVNSGEIMKIYGLNVTQTSALFGKAPLMAAVKILESDYAGKERIAAWKKQLEARILAERYDGTDMEFGAW